MQKRFFPAGKDNKKRAFQDYRWNRFKKTDPRDIYGALFGVHGPVRLKSVGWSAVSTHPAAGI
jgi:hypothetical protein